MSHQLWEKLLFAIVLFLLTKITLVLGEQCVI